LPGGDDEHAPVTLDLGTPAAVRARASGQDRATEVVLSRSEVTGPPRRLCTKRSYVARALRLGLVEIQVVKTDGPIQARDGRRQYVWIPLDPSGALAPGERDLRVRSETTATAAQPETPESEVIPVTVNPPAGQPEDPIQPGTNGHAAPNGTGFGNLLAEAQELQQALRDALGRTNRLLAALKQHRQQVRAVRSTLASLRQLQQVDV
jgi:hypothetical protein